MSGNDRGRFAYSSVARNGHQDSDEHPGPNEKSAFINAKIIDIIFVYFSYLLLTYSCKYLSISKGRDIRQRVIDFVRG